MRQKEIFTIAPLHGNAVVRVAANGFAVGTANVSERPAASEGMTAGKPKGPDLNAVFFLNADGTKTAYLFDYPVKYIDESGTVHFTAL